MTRGEGQPQTLIDALDAAPGDFPFVTVWINENNLH
jgi:hypothetical protein